MSYSQAQIPFAPRGPLVTIQAAVSAPLGVQVPVNVGEVAAGRFRITNYANQRVRIGWGSTALLAQANANFGQDGPNRIDSRDGVEVLTMPANAYFSASVAAGTGSISMTSGEGL